VPFLVLGGTALGTGRGEVLSPVLVRPVIWHWVVAVADGGLSTPEVYRHLDELRDAGRAGPPLAAPEELMAALRQKNPEVLAGCLGNDMQAAALSLRPALAETLDAGAMAGALGGIVSGSGPTCVFLARDGAHAQAVATALEDSGTCRAALVAAGPVAGARPV
jgi:4-diphosphocytidyl-2-C-methyl-D-erythritol kinase